MFKAILNVFFISMSRKKQLTLRAGNNLNINRLTNIDL